MYHCDVTYSAAKDLESSSLNGKSPSQVGDVYPRLVSFLVRSVCFHSLW